MAYIKLNSGYCTVDRTVNSATIGVRYYWELRLYTTSGSESYSGKSYPYSAGDYKLYYNLQAAYNGSHAYAHIHGKATGTSDGYIYLKNGSTTLVTYVAKYSGSNPLAASAWFNKNSSGGYENLHQGEWGGEYTIYPNGMVSVTEGTTLNLNIEANTNIIARTSGSTLSNYNGPLNKTSGNTSVYVGGGKFTLTKVSATGSLLAVKRNGTDLANGTTIYQNDVLNITYSEQTGYITTLTVNGTTRSSGYSHTVSGDTTVITTATLKSYNFSASPSSHGQIRVRRTAGQSPLNTDLVPGTDKLYYNDIIQVIFSIQGSAYEIVSCTMNGSVVPAETNFGVTPNTDDFTYAFAMTEQIKRWALSVTENNYTNKINYVINRISSPSGLGTITTVDNGDLIYYNDVLQLEWQCDPGYSADCKVNSTTIQEVQLPYQWTVTQSPNLYLYGNIIQYILTRAATDCTITVERISSSVSGAPIGIISDDEKIYYGDILEITVLPSPDYQLSTFTINNIDSTTPQEWEVTGSTSIVAICITVTSGSGYIKIGDGWISGQAYILINNNWQQCQGYILQNGQWVQCQ